MKKQFELISTKDERKRRSDARKWAIEWLRSKGHSYIKGGTGYVDIAWVMARTFPRIICVGEFSNSHNAGDFLANVLYDVRRGAHAVHGVCPENDGFPQ